MRPFNPALALGEDPSFYENQFQLGDDLAARANAGDQRAQRVLRETQRALASGRPMALPGQQQQQPPQPQQPQQPQQRQAPPAARQPGFQRAVAMQAGPLDGVVGRIEDAIGDENRSRVSQLREMRRMAHEKDIEQIRAQAALERVRQARMVDEWSSGGVLAPGLIDLTGTAKRIG